MRNKMKELTNLEKIDQSLMHLEDLQKLMNTYFVTAAKELADVTEEVTKRLKVEVDLLRTYVEKEKDDQLTSIEEAREFDRAYELLSTMADKMNFKIIKY